MKFAGTVKLSAHGKIDVLSAPLSAVSGWTLGVGDLIPQSESTIPQCAVVLCLQQVPADSEQVVDWAVY